MCKALNLVPDTGIQFLPLDKNTFLKAQSFVNSTESKFSSIHYTVFIYNDHLIWSGLEQEDMRVLYKYLTQGAGPGSASVGAVARTASPGGPGADAGRTASSPAARPAEHRGGFLTGPEDLTDKETPINAPRMFVSAEDDKELHLVIYACNEVKMCFLVDSATILDLEFYRALSAFIGEPLQDIAREIDEQQHKRTSSNPEVQYKYLYFNHMNLAQKSSFMTLPKKCGQPTISSVSPEYIRYLTDMHTDFSG